MLVPYTVDVPMERLPWANWLLTGITVLVSVIVWVDPTKPPTADPDDDESPAAAPLLPSAGLRAQTPPLDPFNNSQMRPTRHALPPDVLSQLLESGPPAGALRRNGFAFWQLFTYEFLHGDVLHLAGNMIFLFCFGNSINAKLGHLLFLELYFCMGAIAGCAWLLFGGHQGNALIGASGAIAGMTGIFLVLYPRNDICVFYLNGAGFGTFRVSSYWMVLLYMIQDLLGTIAGGGRVAYVCHLGGEVFGALTATSLLLTGVVTSEAYEENLLQVFGILRPHERYAELEKPLSTKKRAKRKKNPDATKI